MKQRFVFYKYWKSISFSIIANTNIYCNEIKWRKDFILNVFEVEKNEDGTPYLIGCDEIYINDERIYMRDCEKLRDFVIKHINERIKKCKKNIEENKKDKLIEDLKLIFKIETELEVVKVKLKNKEENTGYYYIKNGGLYYDSFYNFKKDMHKSFNLGTVDSKYEVVKNSKLRLNIIDNIKIKLNDKGDIEKFNILFKHHMDEYFDKNIQILKEEINKLKIDDSFDFNKVIDFKSYIIEYIKKNTRIKDSYNGKKEAIIDDIIKLGYTDEELNNKVVEFEKKRDDKLKELKDKKVKKDDEKKDDEKKDDEKKDDEKKDDEKKDKKPTEEKTVEEQKQIVISNQKPEEKKKKEAVGICNCNKEN